MWQCSNVFPAGVSLSSWSDMQSFDTLFNSVFASIGLEYSPALIAMYHFRDLTRVERCGKTDDTTVTRPNLNIIIQSLS